jgi:hypothetical protein
MPDIGELLDLAQNKTAPPADIAICSICGWRGPTSECEIDQEGDWESGYYSIHLCPKCEDGGCIDDYDMTPKRQKEWEEWNLQQQKEKK